MSRLFKAGDLVRYDEPGTEKYCFARLKENPVREHAADEDVWLAWIVGHGTLYPESPTELQRLPEVYLTAMGRPAGASLFTLGTLAVLVTAVIGVWLIGAALTGVILLLLTAAGLLVLIGQRVRERRRFSVRGGRAA